MEKTKILLAACLKIFLFRIYLFRGFLCFFMCLVLFSIINCSPVRTKDYLPSGIAKGYIEFYCECVKAECPGNPKLYYFEEKSKEKIYEGHVQAPIPLIKYAGFRIARTPGTYRFSVEFGTAESIVSVVVKQGMVTPVKISFSDINISASGAVIRTTFRMQVTAEEPVPFKSR